MDEKKTCKSIGIGWEWKADKCKFKTQQIKKEWSMIGLENKRDWNIHVWFEEVKLEDPLLTKSNSGEF